MAHFQLHDTHKSPRNSDSSGNPSGTVPLNNPYKRKPHSDRHRVNDLKADKNDSAKDEELELRREAADRRTEDILEQGLAAQKELEHLRKLGAHDAVPLTYDGSTLRSEGDTPIEELTWLTIVAVLPGAADGTSESSSATFTGHRAEQSAVAEILGKVASSSINSSRSWEDRGIRVFSSNDHLYIVLPNDEELLRLITEEMNVILEE